MELAQLNSIYLVGKKYAGKSYFTAQHLIPYFEKIVVLDMYGDDKAYTKWPMIDVNSKNYPDKFRVNCFQKEWFSLMDRLFGYLILFEDSDVLIPSEKKLPETFLRSINGTRHRNNFLVFFCHHLLETHNNVFRSCQIMGLWKTNDVLLHVKQKFHSRTIIFDSYNEVRNDTNIHASILINIDT